MAAIAAALPRLHTLDVFTFQVVEAAAVAGFFEDLLPRLQDFECGGLWPQDPTSQYSTSSSPPPPLPHLRTLEIYNNHGPPWARFTGARPLELRADNVTIERWLAPLGDGGGVMADSPLASVRTLFVLARGSTNGVLTPMDVARILRASPNLETLSVSTDAAIDASWLAQSAHPAFGRLVHSKLRRIRCYGEGFSTILRPDVKRLRRRPHFPRLKWINFCGRDCFVTPLESPSLVGSLFHRFVDSVSIALQK
jgi:hypothetical protein